MTLGDQILDDVPPERLTDYEAIAMRQPPRKFPLPALRRRYLEAAYKWYEWRDG